MAAVLHGLKLSCTIDGTTAQIVLVVLQLPGAGAGKPDVKGLADKAVKKSPLGFMHVGDLAFDLPGSGVSKDDLPNNVKPGDAAGLPKGVTAKPPSFPNLPKVLSGHRLCGFEMHDNSVFQTRVNDKNL